MTSRWYVITGSASCGKTTLINALAKMGYLTVPEAARTVIDKGIKNGKTVEEIRKDEIEFQRKVLELKIKTEKDLPKDKIVFFDRAIPDTIAYLQVYDIDTRDVIKFCKEKKTYRKIFMLERLPLEKDYARVEDNKTLNKIQSLLRKAYSELGYVIIDVPVMPLEDRIKLILSNID